MSYPNPYGAAAPSPYPAGSSAPPGYGAPPPGYERAAGAPVAPPVANSGAQYFTSPEQEAAGKYKQGQAAFNEQDEFNDPSGKYKLAMKGAYAAVECAVVPGDSIKAEAGAMVTMSNNIDLEAKIEGSAGDAFLRCCYAGESLFMSHFTLKPGMGQRGDLLLAPAVPGDIMLLHLNGQHPWAIQKSSYMASDPSVVVTTKVRKIDNGFLVAWSEHLQYTIGKASKSIVSSFLSGEGFVCTFTGPGVIYVQTRSIIGLASAISLYISAPGGGGGGGVDFGDGGF